MVITHSHGWRYSTEEANESSTFFTHKKCENCVCGESLTTIIFMIMAIQLLDDKGKARGGGRKLLIMKYCTIACA